MQTRREDICDIEGELHFLNPERVRFSLNEFDDLTVELEKGVTHSPLILRRAFPLTMGDQYIAVKKVEGDELGIIRKVSDLDPDSQHVLYAQLNMVYFCSKNYPNKFHQITSGNQFLGRRDRQRTSCL